MPSADLLFDHVEAGKFSVHVILFPVVNFSQPLKAVSTMAIPLALEPLTQIVEVAVDHGHHHQREQ
jgi:hypothetical protein